MFFLALNCSRNSDSDVVRIKYIEISARGSNSHFQQLTTHWVKDHTRIYGMLAINYLKLQNRDCVSVLLEQQPVQKE